MRLGIHALLLVCLLGSAPLLGGCAATVIPQAEAKDPAPVFIADYGIHSSLFLPTPDGRFVEYAFGDWGYAAENHNWPHDALGALLMSFQSAFGRRYFDVKPGQDGPQPDRKPNSMQKIVCEREAVNRLLERLDARYRAAGHKPVKNPENGIEYVRDVEHYSVANNCNHLTARSLRELGCEVRGLVVGSSFKVEYTRARPRKPQANVAVGKPSPEWGSARIE